LKPDLDERSVGNTTPVDSRTRGWDKGRSADDPPPSSPPSGAGRDVNNLRDAGDVMAILRELKIDMVLSGHRHVPV